MKDITPMHVVHPIVRNLVEQEKRKNPRDASLSEWDYVTAVGKSIAGRLCVPRGLLAAIRDVDLSRNLRDRNLFEARLLQVKQDLTTLTAEFNAIEQNHVGKRGSAMSATEMAQAFEIVELYEAFAPRAEATMEETMSHIIDMLQAAQDDYVADHVRRGTPYRGDILGDYVKEHHAEPGKPLLLVGIIDPTQPVEPPAAGQDVQDINFKPTF